MKLTISNTDTNPDLEVGGPEAWAATVALYVDGGTAQFLAPGESRSLTATKTLEIKDFPQLDHEDQHNAFEYARNLEAGKFLNSPAIRG